MANICVCMDPNVFKTAKGIGRAIVKRHLRRIATMQVHFVSIIIHPYVLLVVEHPRHTKVQVALHFVSMMEYALILWRMGKGNSNALRRMTVTPWKPNTRVFVRLFYNLTSLPFLVLFFVASSAITTLVSIVIQAVSVHRSTLVSIVNYSRTTIRRVKCISARILIRLQQSFL